MSSKDEGDQQWVEVKRKKKKREGKQKGLFSALTVSPLVGETGDCREGFRVRARRF